MKPIRLPKKRSKYGNVKTTIDGRVFASKAEAEHYLILKDREEKGEIKHLECQYPFDIYISGILVCRYVADFHYIENRNWVTVDVKGCRTGIYQIKKKLMKAIHGIDIKEINVKSKWRRKRK